MLYFICSDDIFFANKKLKLLVKNKFNLNIENIPTISGNIHNSLELNKILHKIKNDLKYPPLLMQNNFLLIKNINFLIQKISNSQILLFNNIIDIIKKIKTFIIFITAAPIDQKSIIYNNLKRVSTVFEYINLKKDNTQIISIINMLCLNLNIQIGQEIKNLLIDIFIDTNILKYQLNIINFYFKKNNNIKISLINAIILLYTNNITKNKILNYKLFNLIIKYFYESNVILFNKLITCYLNSSFLDENKKNILMFFLEINKILILYKTVLKDNINSYEELYNQQNFKIIYKMYQNKNFLLKLIKDLISFELLKKFLMKTLLDIQNKLLYTLENLTVIDTLNNKKENLLIKYAFFKSFFYLKNQL